MITKTRKEELIKLVNDKKISVDELKMLVNKLVFDELNNSPEGPKTSGFKFWD